MKRIEHFALRVSRGAICYSKPFYYYSKLDNSNNCYIHLMMNKYVVIGNQHLTPSTLLLTLKQGSKTKPLSFKPGQYAVISFKQKGRPTPARCFSIVNSPTTNGIIQCSIRIKGRFTNAVSSLKEGDVVNIGGPFGGFVFDEDRDRDMVLIAGGIGITPFMSMIQYATNNKLTNNITLIYNCSDQNDIPFYEQLIDIEKRNPYFKIVFSISKGPIDRFSGYIVKSGRINPEIIEQAVNGSYRNKTFFICGPTAFMNAVTDILFDKGVSEDKIMIEAFGQGSNFQKSNVRNWPFNVYVLGAIGVVLASFLIMIGDLLKTVPLSASSTPNSVNSSSTTNSRQDELNNLINSSDDDNGNSNQTTTNNNSTMTTPAATTQTNSTSTPKCTTTQSGVTTCV
jgi:ferredoxin-NADP reductase